MSKFRLGLLATALVALLSGCGAPSPQSPQPKATIPISTGTSSSHLNLMTITGKPIAINPNQKTLLYFMALGCSSCVTGEMKLVKNLPHIHANVISVDVQPQDTPSELEGFMKQTGATWPHVIDKNQSLIQKYQISYLDTVVILFHYKVIYKGIAPSAQTIETELSS